MNFPLYTDVILLNNVPEENLQVGDIGTVVECHEVAGLETGYSRSLDAKKCDRYSLKQQVFVN
ncbi:DUF4926 domain-containing protein [Phormidium nigroviride]